MILVVDKNSNMILNRCDAWLLGGEEKMIAWAIDNGYKPLSKKITMMGDMVIFVESEVVA